MRQSFTLAVLFAAGTAVTTITAGTAGAEIVTEAVEYQADDTTLKGYLAYDDAVEGQRPGVLVVHEWWGLNDHARERARALAEMGYTALAVDMYGDGKTAGHPDEAGAFAGAVRSNQALGQTRFLAGKEVLEGHPTTDPDHIAAIGYCFGGSVVLQMARDGVDLDAVASFHGGLNTEHPAEPGAVQARVLVLHGGADTFIPDEQVQAFEDEMQEAGADYRLIVYPGATHSFTNPGADELNERFGMPIAYHPEADRQSWAELEAFLAEAFGG